MSNPVPEHSAPHIRDVFARMSMNNSETVALIGGGHAFGKAHGACPTGAGPDPKESPEAPGWPGTCGSGPEKGKGKNTFTAGFELQWTTRPTEWTNEYFHSLLNYNFKLVKSPGDAPQFAPVHKPGGPAAPPSEVGMLTTDVALIRDPAYLELVKLYAKDISQLENDFGAAWYKLVTRDMGPATRCINADAPPPQPFQFTLPDPPKVLADFSKVAKAVRKILRSKPGTLLQASASSSSTLRSRSRELLSSSDREGEEAVSTSVVAEWIAPDTDHAGNSYYSALLVQLAWQCASTFRSTDYQGGCNGARIKLSPQKDWEVNKGMNELLMVLTGIKSQFDWGPGGALSWADLIVIAGTVALEDAAGTSAPHFEFCGGRVDARHGDGGPEYLAPRDIPNAVLAAREEMLLLGLTPRQAVALQARLRSPSRQALLGYSGSWNPASPDQLSNSYFKVLLNTHWEPHTSAAESTMMPALLSFKSTSSSKMKMHLLWRSLHEHFG
ncbi:hypothetical protein CEUSTIGMA_g3877.t1 [Chlamydomonas eustigma]|uniref:Plant heme peroxidase family profile domain-containing protein n=1 Tax=Chlamydomonas eustigma TaxID=1157962 RepID=A0A250X0L1_9CHLO|nr:hypothetical protein CEUSTIGMA_g3877.t1 [Chlamydomonas eustigma]|eukprot:GAX76432.1 hypothetical protein CEUSTIGMA_g3877.t1 [Chlamydomonas eustigma]